jgi:glycosyltransferase involved in cell wall biosynthesis
VGLVQKIVLVTSGQPSLNPRLVKEADALANAGYEVVVIYQYWNDWGTRLDIELLKTKRWVAHRVGGSPNEQKLIYWYTRIRHKFVNCILKLLGYRNFLVEVAIGRCGFLLIKKAKTIKADLYIGHNLAALSAVVKVAKYHKSKCGFDAEDLHRFETNIDYDIKLKTYIEERYFNHVDYLTTSSPQIAKKYKELFPSLIFDTILNVFPKKLKIHRSVSNQPLKLFWFSQNVGLSRGLQDVIRSLKILEEYDIEFHILGFLGTACKVTLDQLIDSLAFDKPPHINFYEPIPSSEVAEFASQFNIGLATEPGFSTNNHLALSNKLFTYLQAGLAIVATETVAQKEFINENPSIGTSYEIGNVRQLANIFSNYIQNPALLTKNQVQAYQLFETTLNWDKESDKFLSIVNKNLTWKKS